MSRQLLILWAGRHARPQWQALCADYRQRVEHEMPVQDQLIKAKCSSQDPARRAAEGKALLAALPDPCWPIAVEPKGRRLDSRQLARELRRLRTEWPHPIAFLIGSDLGLEPSVLPKMRDRLSFGSMIFGHELARLMLYEQIYRALAMNRGLKYHRS